MVVKFNHLLPAMPELGMGLPNAFLDNASERAFARHLYATSRATANDEKSPIPLTALFHLVQFNESKCAGLSNGRVHSAVTWEHSESQFSEGTRLAR